MTTRSRSRALDLRRRRRQLRRDDEHPARRERLPGLRFSRVAARHDRNLRDRRHSEFRRESGRVAGRDRSAEIAGRRAIKTASALCSPGMFGRTSRAEVQAASPRAGCRVCGQRDFVHLAGEGRPHITLCGRNSVQIHEREGQLISLKSAPALSL